MTTHPPTQIGRYRIERELGRGTMGVVYQARDTTLGRTVALKTFGAMAAISPHEREAFEARFLSEARISATLDDENVVGVYDVGRDFESGLLFMALEYVRGETLSDALARGAMPWEDAARIVAKVARALQAAHAHHIVHRDIKPANIMLTAAGEPKIMDFGIAKASASQLTVAGQVFGTPAYMSPEQASGEEVDGRSDIFSLGAVLYELVTNRRPFEGATMAATLTKILRDEPVPASSFVKVPKGLDSVIGRALRKERDARYDSAAHLASDLECLLDGKPPMYATKVGPLDTLDLPKGPPPTRSSTVPAVPAGRSRVATPIENPPANRLAPRLIGAVALSALAVGAVFYLQSRPEGEAAPPPAATANAVEGASALAPSATPVPTLPSPRAVATPTTNTLSMESAGAPATLTLDLRHPFGSGSLRIKVDDRVVFANSISGMPIRSGGVTSGYDGRFGTDLTIPAGDHIILIEVRSGGVEFIESSTLRLRSGDRRRLLAHVDKTMTLTFE